jgi:hypothetical protein
MSAPGRRTEAAKPRTDANPNEPLNLATVSRGKTQFRLNHYNIAMTNSPTLESTLPTSV